MARKRDSWDKVNRQKGAQRKRGVGPGPSPVGAILDRIKKQKENLKRQKESERLNTLNSLARVEWRQFSISTPVLALLKVHDVDADKIINATKSALTCDPIQFAAKPVKFWLFNRKVEKLTRKPSVRGCQTEQPAIPERLLPWILKFKRKTPRSTNSFDPPATAP